MSTAFESRDTTAPSPATEPCPNCGAPGGHALLGGPDRFVGAPGHFEVVACDDCGLATTRPQLRAEDFGVYYPNDYTAYEPRPQGAAATWRSRLGALVDRLRIDAILRLGPYRPLSAP